MILTVIVIVGALMAIISYNKMVELSRKSDETYANVEVILKQRFETLPNLVKTVKRYMGHENETLTKITEIRNAIQNPQAIKREIRQAEASLSQELPKIFVSAEAYPDLKADKNFLHLQKTIVNLEENLSAARRAYNANINTYNTYIQRFPWLIFATLFRFKKKIFSPSIKPYKIIREPFKFDSVEQVLNEDFYYGNLKGEASGFVFF